MRRQHTHGWLRQCIILALILSLRLASALAQVPDATTQRLVEINVEQAQLQILRSSGEITGQEYTLRDNPLSVEKRALEKEVNALPAPGPSQAIQQIQGLINARVAILRPQWEKQAEAFKQATRQHLAAVAAAIPVDVRAALEPQRRRLQLQQQRDRGEITPEEFATADKKALDEIMALRNKYVPEGSGFVAQFDNELTRQSGTLSNTPATTTAAKVSEQAKPKTPPRSAFTSNPNNFIPNIDEDDRRRWATAKSAANAAALKAEADWVRHIHEFFSLMEIIGIVVVVGFVGLVLYAWLLKKKPPPEEPARTVYGSAHYAPQELDITDENCLANGVFFGKSGAPGAVRGPLDAPGAPICSTPENHTLIVAATRTGKGTRVIIPTLLRYSGSVFVIDPKGENAAITARVRAEHPLGQRVHILNPWNELSETYREQNLGERASYNPLEILDRKDPNVVAVAQTLAGAICPASANAKDRFWQGSAANMLTAIFLWLADQAGERKTLARVREIIGLSRKEFTEKYLVYMAASEAFSGAIKEMAAPFIDLAPDTYSGIIAHLNETTKFLSDPQVKAATATSSFSMEDLVNARTTVYVVIPTDKMEMQKTWLRLVVAAAMHAFKRPRKPYESRHRCLFLIDEFAALGRIDDMPRDIATMAGFGVDFALVVQGLDQLKDHYGEARGTILSNCAYKWFCNVTDLESAKYFSEMLGKKTAVTESKSFSSGGGQNGTGSTSTTSYGETARSLLNPDEIMNMGKNVAFVFHPHGHPHVLRPVDYWNLSEAFTSLKEKHPSLYWEPQLRYDDNPWIKGVPPAPPPTVSDRRGMREKEKVESTSRRWWRGSSRQKN